MLRQFDALFNNSTNSPGRKDLNANCFRLSLTKKEKDYFMNCVEYSSKKKNVILVMREIICYGIGYEEYSKFTLDQRQRITRMIEHDVEEMIAKFRDCLENLRAAICNYILKFRYNMALVKWFNTASDDVKRYYFTNETGPYDDFLKSCRKLQQKNEILLDVQVLRLHLLKVFKNLTKLESAKIFMTLSAENQKRGKKVFDIFQINDKINNYEYKNWGEFQDDCLTMIEKFRPKIKKIEKEIIDVFEKDFAELIKPIAKLYGNCCGELLFYSKVRQFCYSNPDCRINPGDEYYCHDLPSNNPNDLIAHYTLCKKCYKDLPETGLNIASSSTDLEELIPKSSFEKLINFENIQEKFIFCYHCGRRWHAVCGMFFDKCQKYFLCGICSKFIKTAEREYLIKDLPVNEIDSYIEHAVNQRINREHPEFGHKDRISVRLVSNIEKQVDIKPLMRELYKKNNIPEELIYKSKVLLVFQGPVGEEILFFSMFIQEYGDDCGVNSNSVYIAYLDSVYYFQPKYLRTKVYHEILMSYFHYCSKRGFHRVHIWACPPNEHDDYIFNCHPSNQMVPSSEKLQKWYKDLFDEALGRKLIANYCNIYEYVKENVENIPLDLPYFEGDYWQNAIEECITTANEELKEKLREETPKRQRSNSLRRSTSRKSINNNDDFGDAGAKLLKLMEKHCEGFFVVTLQTDEKLEQLEPTSERNRIFTTPMTVDRDNFVSQCRSERWEFSSERHAKYATMCIAYYLHQQDLNFR